MLKYVVWLAFVCSCTSTDGRLVLPREERNEDGKVIVWVHGEVERPGKYVVDEGTTASQVIALAGGIKDDAKSTVVLRHYLKLDMGKTEVMDRSIALACYNGGVEDEICQQGDAILVDRYSKAWLSILGNWAYAIAGLVRK